MIQAPFIPDQVQILNERQCHVDTMLPMFHPFTCPQRSDDVHDESGGDRGLLIATERGWICPFCGYSQNWAHAAMVNVREDSQLNGFLTHAGLEDDGNRIVSARLTKCLEDYRRLYSRTFASTSMSPADGAVVREARNVVSLMLACLNRRRARLVGLTVGSGGESCVVAPDSGWIDVLSRRPLPEHNVTVLMRADRIGNPLHPGYGVGAWTERSWTTSVSGAFWCELTQTGRVSHWRETIQG